MEETKSLELNRTEAFYLHDFVSKSWFEFIDNIVDRDNMTELDKEIEKTLKGLSDKIYTISHSLRRRK